MPLVSVRHHKDHTCGQTTPLLRALTYWPFLWVSFLFHSNWPSSSFPSVGLKILPSSFRLHGSSAFACGGLCTLWGLHSLTLTSSLLYSHPHFVVPRSEMPNALPNTSFQTGRCLSVLLSSPEVYKKGHQEMSKAGCDCKSPWPYSHAVLLI